MTESRLLLQFAKFPTSTFHASSMRGTWQRVRQAFVFPTVNRTLSSYYCNASAAGAGLVFVSIFEGDE